MKYINSLFVLFFVFLFIHNVHDVSAFEIVHLPLSEGNDFIVSPVYIDTDLTETKITTSSISVINHSSNVVDFEITSEPVGGGVASAHQWISLEVPVFHLRPNEKITFTTSIKAPASTSDGMYYANIVVSGTVRDAGAVRLVHRVASRVFVHIDTQHNLRPIGNLIAFKAPWFSENASIPFSLIYKNSGNAVMKQEGALLLKTVFGGGAEPLRVSPFYLLPGEEKHIQLSSRVSGWGVYKAVLTLQGEKQQTRFFIALPLRALFIMSLLIFFIVKIRRLWIT